MDSVIEIRAKKSEAEEKIREIVEVLTKETGCLVTRVDVALLSTYSKADSELMCANYEIAVSLDVI